MGGEAPELSGPDLGTGVALTAIPDGGSLLGHAGGEAVLLARHGKDVFAVSASCSHYGGPLADGLVVGDTVRCPWHHACFSLRTGEAVRAPALAPIACWHVARDGERVKVTSKREVPADGATRLGAGSPRAQPGAIVIVGMGAAGNAAAEMLRRSGFGGTITMVAPEESVPYDRPNLSKDYLAGTATEEWIPLHPREFYAEHQITLRTGRRATSLDTRARRLTLDDGSSLAWDRLLLATGADPIRLDMPGSDRPHVHYLRTLADCNAIISAARGAKRALVMGASFIGLEVAASLRARGLEVHVVAPEARPLERVLGTEFGDFIRALHESKGVVFHLGTSATAVGESEVTLKDGTSVVADLVVIGVGVRPALALAEIAGLALDRGVRVNQFLEASASDVFAAGDIARWFDSRTGEAIRVEHWVVAERQGQVAARNMLGFAEPFRDVPFFWSVHYDMTINYSGHAERWDRIDIDGSLEARDCSARFIAGDRVLAVATVGRDLASLRAELELERSAPAPAR